MSFNGESQSPLRIRRVCLHFFVHVHCSLGWVKFETRVPRLRTGWFSRGRSHAIFITSKIVCVLSIVLCDSHKQTNAAHAPQTLWLTFNWANIYLIFSLTLIAFAWIINVSCSVPIETFLKIGYLCALHFSIQHGSFKRPSKMFGFRKENVILISEIKLSFHGSWFVVCRASLSSGCTCESN